MVDTTENGSSHDNPVAMNNEPQRKALASALVGLVLAMVTILNAAMGVNSRNPIAVAQ